MKQLSVIVVVVLGLGWLVSLGLAWAGVNWLGDSVAGPPWLLGLVLAAAALSRWPLTRGIAYACCVLAFVAAAWFYPAWLTAWTLPLGGAEPYRFELKRLMLPLIQIIMFGMGCTLSVSDFRRVLTMPRPVVLGLVLQFTVMPLVGFLLAWVGRFPDEVAAGLILVGCCPGGVASNVVVYLARGNVALSVTMTAISSLVAPVVTPALMQLLAGTRVPIEPLAMFWTIVQITILPVAAGLAVHHLAYRRLAWLPLVLPIISVLAIGLIVGIITALARETLAAVAGSLVLAVAMHNTAGFVMGYWLARLCGLSKHEARTVSIEVGLQNSGMASTLAVSTLKSAAVGVAPAVFGPWMNVAGSLLAAWWRQSPVEPQAPQSSAAEVPVT